MGLLGSVFKQFGLPDNALERLMGFDSDGDQKPSFRPSVKALRHLPRSVKFAVKLARFDRIIESYLKGALVEYSQLESQLHVDSTADEIMAHIEQLYILNQRTAYYDIIAPLLMRLFHRLAKRNLTRRGVDYTRINWLEGWEDRTDYDPIHHYRRLGTLYRNLDTVERQIVASGDGEGSDAPKSFYQYLRGFLDRFGHLSDSGNDFSYPAWQETPELVFNLIRGYADDSTARRSEQPPNPANVSLSRGFFVKQAVKWSRYREVISFLYTRGVSMFRRTYQRIGDHFWEQGWLDEVDDIFYLEHAEIVSAVRQGKPEGSFKEWVSLRKQEYALYEQITPPPIIYGDLPPPIVDQAGSKLQGVPASRGLHRGVVQVVKGLSDFSKCVPGCVLVIPYSDVSWTPLFARAGAVVAEAGGLLSHSAIIAREFGIPAIVSVPHAVQLEDGIEVTVDGFTGNIILHNTSLAEDA
jgi:pyruvate,water dikinase